MKTFSCRLLCLLPVLSSSLLEAVNYYHKELHLGCCSSPRSASASCLSCLLFRPFPFLLSSTFFVFHLKLWALNIHLFCCLICFFPQLLIYFNKLFLYSWNKILFSWFFFFVKYLPFHLLFSLLSYLNPHSARALMISTSACLSICQTIYSSAHRSVCICVSIFVCQSDLSQFFSKRSHFRKNIGEILGKKGHNCPKKLFSMQIDI